MSDKGKVSSNVPLELKQWFIDEAAKSGSPSSALISLAMLEYKNKTESESK